MNMMSLDPLAVWIPTAWLATLMVHAGLVKHLDRALFEQHLSAYRVPDAWLAVLGWTLPTAEMGLGLLLLSPWRDWGAVGSCALLLLYAAAMAWHRKAGRQLNCGCGGEPLPLSWTLVLRNLSLALLCWPASAVLAPRPMHIADYGVTLGAVLLGALLWAAFHQVLRQTRRPNLV
ncbi:hypothetical protein B9Z51_17245 [Limnohabitans sp. T6-5]|uniref:MauE/DoxX family redox-associated membrane protein n=1 Tax=Limnohabitans sp. T6-5 TaxID=1100724 RepID=UPI000D37D9BB|nr:MauE/DoxX family redox-associated membrane protein [Limnohabitans sp. T6-5]PUE05991.1 hypothetical protein B9Z51_17245 [Limnohabitans sp. T6-5]